MQNQRIKGKGQGQGAKTAIRENSVNSKAEKSV